MSPNSEDNSAESAGGFKPKNDSAGYVISLVEELLTGFTLRFLVPMNRIFFCSFVGSVKPYYRFDRVAVRMDSCYPQLGNGA